MKSILFEKHPQTRAMHEESKKKEGQDVASSTNDLINHPESKLQAP
jgi:hypothetical protein